MYFDEEKDLVVDEGEPDGTQDAPAGDKAVGKDVDPLAGLPLHLHPRGKELVAEKNKYKDSVAQYERLGAPTDIAQKMARLEILEEMVAADDAKPGTVEQEKEAAQAAWARKQLDRLLPELKAMKGMSEQVKYLSNLIEMHKQAVEEEAWDATQELADQTVLEPDELAQKLIGIIKEDKKLLRMYNSGKSEKAVQKAFEDLPAKYLRKDAKSIEARAKELKDSKETSGKLPKTHTPGRTEGGPEPKKPTTWAEAEERMKKRMEKMG